MSKRSIQIQETPYCGVDVSAKNLTVAIQHVGQPVEQRSFPNNPNGHRALIVWLRKAKFPVRVSLEATGIYSLISRLHLMQRKGSTGDQPDDPRIRRAGTFLRDFKTLPADDMQLLRDHGKQFDDGRHELYKSTMKYDRDLGRSLHGYPSSAVLPV